MPKKILSVLGSVRLKGNSARLLEAAERSCAAAGASVERVDLGSFRPLLHCTGCDGCRRSPGNRCVLGDGLAEKVQALREADAFILATPVYFFGFPSLPKAFVDRAFYSSERAGATNLLKGKGALLLVTYGGEDEADSGAANLFASFRESCAFTGVELRGLVHGKTTEAEGPSQELLAEASAATLALLGR